MAKDIELHRVRVRQRLCVQRFQTRDELRTLLDDLSAGHETPLSPKKPWTMDKLPAQRADAMMNAIVGFAVNFESVLGKFKLSQDKSADDISNVIAALEARCDTGSLAIARAMREHTKA
ncbi:MAG TPA: FMN-binding negative transcriptional regulator [Rhizomicrobium sp.]|nr:FMN-binding negative transcriptional regulator [Rhizomicrobium sp.]